MIARPTLSMCLGAFTAVLLALLAPPTKRLMALGHYR